MAQHRHKRETNARRPKAVQVAGTVAVMATISAVSLGVVTASPPADEFLASPTSTISGSDQSISPRQDIVSRSESRLTANKVEKREAKQQAQRRAQRRAAQQQKATRRAVNGADTKMWSTTELNLWAGPESAADKLGVIDGRTKVLLTGRRANGRIEVVVNGESRWVSMGYFAEKKPPAEPTLGGACTNGSSVSGQPNVLKVHEAVCAAFPELTSYGTYRGDGEHAQGIAIDIMVTGDRGWEVAEFVRANYAALGVSYIIFSQHIWSVERGGEGWRAMSDRGSTTANHYDHVHVTTY